MIDHETFREADDRKDDSEDGLDSNNDETMVEVGIWRTIGDLPSGAIVSRRALAEMFGRCEETMDRAIGRGELPPAVKFLGGKAWTVGAIRSHFEDRMRQAREEHEGKAQKLRKLQP